MKKYKVYLMSPYLGWEHIKAKNQDEAKTECEKSLRSNDVDWNDGPYEWLVIPEDND